MKCNTATIIFGQEKFLGLKEAHIDILIFARSSIAWLTFFEETLTYVNFLHYQNFDDAITVYTDFLQKFMVAIDKVASIKERRIKHNSKE